MHEILLGSVTVAAAVRSAWLLIGLVRIIPVHLRARTRRWGPAEVLAFRELPVFLVLTGFLLLRPPEVLLAGTAALLAAVAGSALALAGLYVTPVFWFYIRAEERMMSGEFGEQFEEYQRKVGRLLPRW